VCISTYFVLTRGSSWLEVVSFILHILNTQGIDISFHWFILLLRTTLGLVQLKLLGYFCKGTYSCWICNTSSHIGKMINPHRVCGFKRAYGY
jgi:hypothetical protein